MALRKNESWSEDRWTTTKILGYRIFAIHVVFLQIVVILTIIHFTTAWDKKRETATLAAFITPLIQAVMALAVEGAFLFCLMRCKRTLLQIYSRYQLVFIVILAINATFSFVVIAAGSTQLHYYWARTPIPIFIIDYLTAMMILLEVLLWRKFASALKCLRQEIMIVAPMKPRQHIVQVNSGKEHLKSNGVGSKKKAKEGKSEKENVTELKEVHTYFTRMNVNGYVAKPEVVVRTPTLQRKTYLGGTGTDGDSVSLSSFEAGVAVPKIVERKQALNDQNKHTSFSVSDYSSSTGESSPRHSRKSPYEEMPLNWRRRDKKSSPKKKKDRPKSEMIHQRSPSPDMIFQVLPPKPWPPHGP